MPSKITKDDLSKIPLRAMVAWAARCARRVQPLYHVDGLSAKKEHKHVSAIDQVIGAAEAFANSVDDKTFEGTRAYNILDAGRDARDAAGHGVAAWVATSALNAARSAVYAAQGPTGAIVIDAEDAFDCAIKAAESNSSEVSEAASADFQKLLAAKLGDFPELGQPVDPSASGALGPLWPSGVPQWYTTGFAQLQAVLSAAKK